MRFRLLASVLSLGAVASLPAADAITHLNSNATLFFSVNGDQYHFDTAVVNFGLQTDTNDGNGVVTVDQNSAVRQDVVVEGVLTQRDVLVDVVAQATGHRVDYNNYGADYGTSLLTVKIGSINGVPTNAQSSMLLANAQTGTIEADKSGYQLNGSTVSALLVGGEVDLAEGGLVGSVRMELRRCVLTADGPAGFGGLFLQNGAWVSTYFPKTWTLKAAPAYFPQASGNTATRTGTITSTAPLYWAGANPQPNSPPVWRPYAGETFTYTNNAFPTFVAIPPQTTASGTRFTAQLSCTETSVKVRSTTTTLTHGSMTITPPPPGSDTTAHSTVTGGMVTTMPTDLVLGDLKSTCDVTMVW